MTGLQVSPMIKLPQVCPVEELESSLPLELTSIHAQLSGPLASVLVRQRFGNPLKEPAELDYLFPLPEAAAITSFVLPCWLLFAPGTLRAAAHIARFYGADCTGWKGSRQLVFWPF